MSLGLGMWPSFGQGDPRRSQLNFPSRLKTDPPKEKAIATFFLARNAHIGLKDCLELLSSLIKEKTPRTAELTIALSFGQTDKPSLELSLSLSTLPGVREKGMPLLFKSICVLLLAAEYLPEGFVKMELRSLGPYHERPHRLFSSRSFVCK